MSDASAVRQIKDTTANPAPLGLLAFGVPKEPFFAQSPARAEAV